MAVFHDNPLLKTDYPDADVIRVGEIYYMVSTTMYFMPGFRTLCLLYEGNRRKCRVYGFRVRKLRVAA